MPIPSPGATKAWRLAEGEIPVAKVLRPHVAGEPRAERALAREADALVRLQHPDLVRSFGAVLDGPLPHLVLEVLDGPRLSTLVRRSGAAGPGAGGSRRSSGEWSHHGMGAP